MNEVETYIGSIRKSLASLLADPATREATQEMVGDVLAKLRRPASAAAEIEKARQQGAEDARRRAIKILELCEKSGQTAFAAKLISDTSTTPAIVAAMLECDPA